MPRRFGVTIDCRDPLTLAAFWREVLDYQDDPAPEGYSSWAEYDAANCVSDDDCGGRCHDRRSHRGRSTPVFPEGAGGEVGEEPRASGRGRVRDPEWADVQAAADRVVAAGGRILRVSDDPNDRFIVVGDPEGNEFCLVR